MGQLGRAAATAGVIAGVAGVASGQLGPGPAPAPSLPTRPVAIPLRDPTAKPPRKTAAEAFGGRKTAKEAFGPRKKTAREAFGGTNPSPKRKRSPRKAK